MLLKVHLVSDFFSFASCLQMGAVQASPNIQTEPSETVSLKPFLHLRRSLRQFGHSDTKVTNTNIKYPGYSLGIQP